MVKWGGNPENRDKWDSHSKVRVEKELGRRNDGGQAALEHVSQKAKEVC